MPPPLSTQSTALKYPEYRLQVPRVIQRQTTVNTHGPCVPAHLGRVVRGPSGPSSLHDSVKHTTTVAARQHTGIPCVQLDRMSDGENLAAVKWASTLRLRRSARTPTWQP
jgi:hypothetical protein